VALSNSSSLHSWYLKEKWPTFSKVIEKQRAKVFIPFSCRPGVQAGSIANELASHLAFKEHQNSVVSNTNFLEKLLGEETIFLQPAVNDDNFQRVTEKEIQTSEIQPEVLRERIVQDSLLSQGSKTKEVSNIIFII